MNAWNCRLKGYDIIWMLYYSAIFLFSCAIDNAQMALTIFLTVICVMKQVILFDGRVKIARIYDNSFWYGIFFLFVLCSRFWSTTEGIEYINLFTTLIQIVALLLCMDWEIRSLEKAIIHIRCFCYASFLFSLVVVLTSSPSTYNTLDFGMVTGMHRNITGYLLMMAACFDLFLASKVYKSYRKWFYMMAVLSIVVSVLSGSRKIIIGYAIMLICWLITQNNIHRGLKNCLLIVGSLLVLILLMYQIPYIQEAFGFRLMAIFDDSIVDGSINARNRAKELALFHFSANPILGKGWNAVASSYGEFYSRNSGIYAHNNYLEIAADFGIVGVILYYIKFLRTLLNCIKTYKRNSVMRLGVICFATILVLDWAQVTYMYLYLMIVYSILFKLTMYARSGEKEIEESANSNCL